MFIFNLPFFPTQKRVHQQEDLRENVDNIANNNKNTSFSQDDITTIAADIKEMEYLLMCLIMLLGLIFLKLVMIDCIE